MKLIVAVSENWGIGKDNGLLFNIPKDMKFFRETTSGKAIILGRKNLESFPGGRPLKNRENIVLTNNKSFKAEGAKVFHSVSEVLDYVGAREDVFVIGGESIYRRFLDYCDTCYVTKVHETADCDRFMVNLDERPDWKLSEQSERIEDNGHYISFCTYVKIG